MNNSFHRLLAGFLVATALAAGASRAAAPESSSFVLDRLTLAASAGRTSSASWVLDVTVGQVVPAGGVSFCNNGFAASEGFWSVLGDVPVPLVLTLFRDPTDPQLAVLRWSGASAAFDVHGSPAPDDVPSPIHLLTMTNACTATDPTPVATDDLLFYLVVPSGP